LLVVLLGGALAYYLGGAPPSQEINYQDFVNQYLARNQVKIITISEDKANESFKYRA
jgi:hypothetical protein